jgi:hypothetical protein
MDGTSDSNSTTEKGSDSGPSIWSMLGVIIAVLVVVAALMTLGPSVFFPPSCLCLYTDDQDAY